MDRMDFFKIYFPALQKVLNHDQENRGFSVLSPDFYMDSEVSLQMSLYEDNELADNPFLAMVNEYFFGLSHYEDRVRGIDKKIFKGMIINKMNELKIMYGIRD